MPSEYLQNPDRQVVVNDDGAVFHIGDIFLRDSLNFLPVGAVVQKIDVKNGMSRFQLIDYKPQENNNNG